MKMTEVFEPSGSVRIGSYSTGGFWCSHAGEEVCLREKNKKWNIGDEINKLKDQKFGTGKKLRSWTEKKKGKKLLNLERWVLDDEQGEMIVG